MQLTEHFCFLISFLKQFSLKYQYVAESGPKSKSSEFMFSVLFIKTNWVQECSGKHYS